MSQFSASDPLPVRLRFNDAVGLFIYYNEAEAGELRDCLLEDKVEFFFNPSEAAHLVRPGKAVFVFGKAHPKVVADSLELIGEAVVWDETVVMPETLYHPPVKQLLSLGELRRGETLDYSALGFSTADAPALIRMATDEALNGGPRESAVVWSPVHAWRALAQLRPAEAIIPLIELFRRTDDDVDDWIGEDLPKSLAQFGELALAPLTAYLAEPSNGEWSRICVARAIGIIGETHPHLRADCIARLNAQLERFPEQSEMLNAFLVSPLWDLRAVEAMPVLERAFASGRVDESVIGDLEDVQIHFGLKDRREHLRKPNRLTEWGDNLRANRSANGLPVPDENGDFPENEMDKPQFAQPYIAPPKVGRNEPCPCGSGKKYKKCCGG